MCVLNISSAWPVRISFLLPLTSLETKIRRANNVSMHFWTHHCYLSPFVFCKFLLVHLRALHAYRRRRLDEAVLARELFAPLPLFQALSVQVHLSQLEGWKEQQSTFSYDQKAFVIPEILLENQFRFASLTERSVEILEWSSWELVFTGLAGKCFYCSTFGTQH